MNQIVKRTACLVVIALVMMPDALWAQAEQLGQQNLRPYWHVFAAYALVLVIIGGWAVSIARRLKTIEDRIRS